MAKLDNPLDIQEKGRTNLVQGQKIRHSQVTWNTFIRALSSKTRGLNFRLTSSLSMFCVCKQPLLPCGDPENFARGGPTLTTFFFF